jgi:hypothetical protein
MAMSDRFLPLAHAPERATGETAFTRLLLISLAALFLDDDGSVYVAFGCSNNDATHMVQLDPSAGWTEVGERLAVARGNGGTGCQECQGDDMRSGGA